MISEYQDYKTSPVLLVLPSSSQESYKRKQMSAIAKCSNFDFHVAIDI